MIRAAFFLAVFTLFGCGGSLRSSVLIASAQRAYPDCDTLELGERAEGITQWILVCGEPRLFGLRAEAEVERERAQRGLREDEREDDILDDVGPPLRWSRVDAQAPEATSVVFALRPLAVSATLLGVGETAYLTVESPTQAHCTAHPTFAFEGEVRVMDSAPTETVVGARRHFAQRIDAVTLHRLATLDFEVAYCGERHALDESTAAALHRWAAVRVRQ